MVYFQATGGKDTGAGTFAARAQSAGDKNVNTAAGGTAGGQGGGAKGGAYGGK
jgi:hypothetical protein